MDKPALERLALDLHSLAEEANTQLRHELGSLLAIASFQQQYIERCHAAMKAMKVSFLKRVQDQDGTDGSVE